MPTTAPMKLLDPTGRPIALAPTPLAVGGEGAIHDVVGDPSTVAKVYKEPQTFERSEKLRAMAKLASPSLLKVAAWPTTTLHPAPGGPVAGILMPKIAGYREIHQLYSVAQRKKDFPDADWRFLVHAARNCAIAFEAIHAEGHVVGDVNQKNVLVSPQAIVQFVDCDSFQVRSPTGKLYRCEVGVPEFTPPELQGQSFRTVDRTPNHDRFGLAVMIFHLLMMGRHPFSGVYAGQGDMPLEKAISTGLFAYSKSPQTTQMKPPPGTPPITILDASIFKLFERAFVAGAQGRPSPTEWKDTLAAFLSQLGPCSTDAKHIYPRSLRACPRGQLISCVGVVFFLASPLAGTQTDPNFNLATVWARIEKFTLDKFHYTRPSPSRASSMDARPVPSRLGTPSPRPSPPEPAKLDDFFEIVSFGGILIGLPLLFIATPVGLLCLFVFGLWYLGLLFTRSSRLERLNRFVRENDQTQIAWEDENWEWLAELHARTSKRDLLSNNLSQLEKIFEVESCATLEIIERIRSKLRASKTRYDEANYKHQNKRHELLKDSQQLQLKQYLDGFSIADYWIKGISSDRVSNLRSFGVETALDVERLSFLKVPQIGPVLTQRLHAWRHTLERNFEFIPGRPSKELLALEQTHRALVSRWEAELAAGPGLLQELLTTFQLRNGPSIRQIQAVVDELHQAELDVEIMERMLI